MALRPKNAATLDSKQCRSRSLSRGAGIEIGIAKARLALSRPGTLMNGPRFAGIPARDPVSNARLEAMSKRDY